MDWIRPKDIRDQFEESQKLFALPTPAQCTEKCQALLSDALVPLPEHSVSVSPHVIQDAQVLDALTSASNSIGANEWIRQQLKHPIHSLPLLKQRQSDLKRATTPPSSTPPHPVPAFQYDADILWALELPPLNKSWPLPLLFPQWFVIRWINSHPMLLNLYQLYRIYGSSLSHLIYPLTLFFGPWWYIRTKLKWKLPLKSYIGFIKTALTEMVKIRTRDVREIVIKIVTLVVYVGLYLYGLIQSLDIAFMLHQTRSILMERIAHIHSFIRHTQNEWERLGFTDKTLQTWNLLPATSSPSSLSSSIQGIYQLFRSQRFHPYLKEMLVKAYTLQGIQAIATQGAFHYVRWRSSPTPSVKLTGMGHPMLSAGQQRNPVVLTKNMILTGPNAAGKSTYVRGILANLLLAQSFGLCCARSAIIAPVQTIASLMRVQDVVGTHSLFEAECRRSFDLIQQAHENRPMVLFLDEPMNATPPIEGAATAMALVKYLSQFPHVRLIVTTHYHVLSNLETLYPTRFRNVSMEATLNPIQFTYKLQPGASYQSIAIEMLEKDAFPQELLKDAIEFKNKICRFENNT